MAFFGSKRDDWIVVILTDDMIGMFDDGVFDRFRDRTGHQCVHVLLVQNIETGNIVVLYATWQMASTIKSIVSTLLYDQTFIFITSESHHQFYTTSPMATPLSKSSTKPLDLSFKYLLEQVEQRAVLCLEESWNSFISPHFVIYW